MSNIYNIRRSHFPNTLTHTYKKQQQKQQQNPHTTKHKTDKKHTDKTK